MVPTGQGFGWIGVGLPPLLATGTSCGTLFGMTHKITVSLKDDTHRLIERAAGTAGLSVSAWLDRAARLEAVRQGFDPSAQSYDDALALAQADQAAYAAANSWPGEERRAG